MSITLPEKNFIEWVTPGAILDSELYDNWTMIGGVVKSDKGWMPGQITGPDDNVKHTYADEHFATLKEAQEWTVAGLGIDPAIVRNTDAADMSGAIRGALFG